MARRHGPGRPRKRRRRRARKLRLSRLLPGKSRRRRWARVWRRAPASIQVTVLVGLVFCVWLGTNWTYQVARKPSELLFPISDSLYKTPAETWEAYGRLFERHSTAVLTPDLLAALAQVEGSGNPIARTYWRWAFARNLFEIFRPASSAVGMYQITDGTFAEARRYCVHDHVVVEAGPWHSLEGCWFNALYTRLVPSHAVELTAAYLDRRVADVLRVHPVADASLEQRQRLAAVIHLCGAAAGARFASTGLVVAPGQRCGAHGLAGYLDRVERMQRVFAAIAKS